MCSLDGRNRTNPAVPFLEEEKSKNYGASGPALLNCSFSPS